jgi:hypothetical protein
MLKEYPGVLVSETLLIQPNDIFTFKFKKHPDFRDIHMFVVKTSFKWNTREKKNISGISRLLHFYTS